MPRLAFLLSRHFPAGADYVAKMAAVETCRNPYWPLMAADGAPRRFLGAAARNLEPGHRRSGEEEDFSYEAYGIRGVSGRCMRMSCPRMWMRLASVILPSVMSRSWV
jgi:hypothetical protein